MQTQCNDIYEQLETWYSRDNGQYLMSAARVATQDLLDTSFGYHILQLGVTGGRPLCQLSPINHQVYCADSARDGIGLVADPLELPLESDSIDTIIAHHCLEFTDNPHQVLREIQRVLTPQGQLLIVGFNPVSLLGCSTRMRGILRDPLWSKHRPLSERRLRDWLNLLGCEVLGVFRLHALPPFGGGRFRQLIASCDAWLARHSLVLGGVYIVHATKQVAGAHRPRWSLRSRSDRLVSLVPKSTPAPQTRSPRRKLSKVKGDLTA
ncbi:MAG: class I SAM-dependent methyltransferase [Halioglobus sp.]|nr:class I SAM-dependent methyltransferase [Halioglobus sp.]